MIDFNPKIRKLPGSLWGLAHDLGNIFREQFLALQNTTGLIFQND